MSGEGFSFFAGVLLSTVAREAIGIAWRAWRARRLAADKPHIECKQTGNRMCPVPGCYVYAPRRYFADRQ